MFCRRQRTRSKATALFYEDAFLHMALLIIGTLRGVGGEG